MNKIKTSRTSALTVSLLILSLLNSCTSFQPVANQSPEALAQSLESGDTVQVTTHEGIEHTVVISAVTDTGIVGEEQTFRFEDIALVETKRMDEAKVRTVATTALVVPLVILGVGLAVLLSSGGAVGFPGP